MRRERTQAIVIGAGIGGLAAALCLHRAVVRTKTLGPRLHGDDTQFRPPIAEPARFGAELNNDRHKEEMLDNTSKWLALAFAACAALVAVAARADLTVGITI